MSDNDIKNTKKEAFKAIVKKKVTEKAFKHLMNIKEGHSKMQHIIYSKLELQKYLKSQIFDNQSSALLLALRTQTVRGIKTDFKGMFADTECPLGCGNIDTLLNILTCPVLKNQMSSDNIATKKVEYSGIFSDDIVKQKQITHMYTQLLGKRGKIITNPAV